MESSLQAGKTTKKERAERENSWIKAKFTFDMKLYGFKVLRYHGFKVLASLLSSVCILAAMSVTWKRSGGNRIMQW